MPDFSIPYGRSHWDYSIPAENLNGIYTVADLVAASDPQREIEAALDAPIGGKPLAELARNAHTCAIIISDHTRPVPSKLLVPPLLKRLRQASPNIDITLLVATGCHRPTTPDELRDMLGETLVKQEKIQIHDCMDKSSLKNFGFLSSGGKLQINRIAAETDCLIGTGFIEPHFFAGFSGGRKCILPGIASRESVHSNHCAQFIESPFARTGILDNNPIHSDMLEAAHKASLAFILNVVLDSAHHIVKAFAGNPDEAHRAGCEFLRSRCTIQVPRSDIVITSNGGYPLDQNVYQAVKGMTAGEAACRPGGVIILCASCCDGIGGEAFRQALSGMSSPQDLLKQILTVPRENTTADQWQYQILARILAKYTVILVTQDCDPALLRAMHLTCATSLDEAMALAFSRVGKEAKVAVIPDGVSVIVNGIEA